ncbi:hypothetical protein AAC387_Pa12g0487 [Persea americana]
MYSWKVDLQHQARGLDVLPTAISRFRSGGDNRTAELLETVVYPEEITHSAAGIKWFKYLCFKDFSAIPKCIAIPWLLKFSNYTSRRDRGRTSGQH